MWVVASLLISKVLCCMLALAQRQGNGPDLRVVLLQVWVVVIGLWDQDHERLFSWYSCTHQQLGHMVQVGTV